MAHIVRPNASTDDTMVHVLNTELGLTPLTTLWWESWGGRY